jgi:hypothetical protein
VAKAGWEGAGWQTGVSENFASSRLFCWQVGRVPSRRTYEVGLDEICIVFGLVVPRLEGKAGLEMTLLLRDWQERRCQQPGQDRGKEQV